MNRAQRNHLAVLTIAVAFAASMLIFKPAGVAILAYLFVAFLIMRLSSSAETARAAQLAAQKIISSKATKAVFGVVEITYVAAIFIDLAAGIGYTRSELFLWLPFSPLAIFGMAVAYQTYKALGQEQNAI